MLKIIAYHVYIKKIPENQKWGCLKSLIIATKARRHKAHTKYNSFVINSL